MDNLSKVSKTVVFHETGAPEVLKLDQVNIPYPAPQEVRIQVKSIGLNRSDTMYRKGTFVETAVLPARLGYEASGIVEAIGSEVTNLAVGDEVSVIPAFSLNSYATYGEYIVMPAYTVIKNPSELSFDESAALWTSYLTTYGMIVNSGKLNAGEFVIINAASSSAGLAAIQLTNYIGGVSIALTTSADKKEALLKAGAAHVIITSTEDIKTEVTKITNNIGAHLILDPIVGSKFSNLVSTVAENGKVFVFGALSYEPTSFPVFDVLMKTPTIKGYSSMEVLMNPQVLGEAVALITKGVSEGKLKPTISRTFNLDEIVEAHQYLESNRQLGKIVVNV